MKALFIISFFCLAVTFNISGQATPQEILNKAIYQEEVNGNLEEAINLFLEIVENNSTNRTVTAEAFYHLGLTNETLGNKKAKEYYEKVVNNFGDKLETVQMAKERLQNLNIQTRNLNVADAKISNQVIAQTIYTPGGFLGAITPNKKHLSVFYFCSTLSTVPIAATVNRYTLTTSNINAISPRLSRIATIAVRVTIQNRIDPNNALILSFMILIFFLVRLIIRHLKMILNF